MTIRCLLFKAVFLSIISVAVSARADKPSPDDAPAPRPAADAAKAFTLPAGFKATLFAGEPDLVQPIAFTIDGRGRLWVVESLTYPHWLAANAKEGKDRIVIFEDADGDGHFDKRTVFADKVVNASGIEVGFGGVYICSTPRLVFYPDKDADDKADGEPEVLLDGWNLDKAGHNVFNGLTWGPDGWLYGMNGIQSKSAVGAPGTPDDKRVKFDCGVWRFHPTRKQVEAVAWGTTNPWGLDFDEYGRMFMTNCVIAHLWHVIPGAHYPRMYGEDYNPHTFGFIESCADHLHFAGKWQEVRKGAENVNADLGGGHAHVGAMVYLGDNWPAEYRGGLFTCNLHGHRINHDLFEPKGSGVVARHGADVMLANDTWFRGLTLRYGPDGSVFASDWSGTGECHDADIAEMDNGRMYKISYGDMKPVKVNIAAMSDVELVNLQLHKNDWYVRAARLELQQRGAAKKLGADVVPALRKILVENADVTRKLRALWALHCIGGLDEAANLELLSNPDANVRGWAMRLQLESKTASDAFLAKLADLAKSDPAPTVRLEIASVLQRVDLNKRWPIIENLIAHGEDVTDQNLPMMYWYTIEPLVGADQARALGLLAKTKIPVIREYVTRRVAQK